ncbi:hypothetical protein [Croceicoccus bisphenolivorans]|uniref:hypothetical protein n=1 Tax=Croceicoccus bisphenolivorans TaxID=1783232 RepID=UPI000834EA89|nr:hypothetical protein [Croceicoccus bisphenolivorans]
MKVIVGQELDLRTLSGRDHPAHVSGYRLENCEVMGTMLASRHPGEWRTIRDCEAIGCRHYNCALSGTAVEDCLIDTMGQAGPGYFTLDGCVFRHVILRGKLTTTLFRFGTDPYEIPAIGPRFSDMWQGEMVRYYRDVDWAIDVTAAKFTAFTSLTTVPGDLVRFDPARAIRIRREMLTGNWADGMPGVMQICCEDFLGYSPFDSFVVQRGEPKKNRERFEDEAGWMRKHGFAEPA